MPPSPAVAFTIKNEEIKEQFEAIASKPKSEDTVSRRRELAEDVRDYAEGFRATRLPFNGHGLSVSDKGDVYVDGAAIAPVKAIAFDPTTREAIKFEPEPKFVDAFAKRTVGELEELVDACDRYLSSKV